MSAVETAVFPHYKHVHLHAMLQASQEIKYALQFKGLSEKQDTFIRCINVRVKLLFCPLTIVMQE